MKEKHVEGILETTIEKMRQLVDVETIIGDPIQVDGGITIIPVSKVTYGFGAGGSDFPSKSTNDIFGGGSGAGISISPIAFLVVQDGHVEIKHITTNDDAVERLVNMIPEVVDKVGDFIQKEKAKKEEK